MKVGILHLSDIHFNSEKDLIFSRHDAFCRSCKHLINECSKVIVVISGDIANYGNEDQYELAYKWLKDCEEVWKKETRILQSFDYVLVPGNHDCNLSGKNPIRDLVINEILKKDRTMEDKYVETCLAVQKPFWGFYSKLVGKTLLPLVSWKADVKIKLDYSLCFHCYNTALLTQLHEEAGKLMIPENYFLDITQEDANQVVISVFHHNTGWLSTSTTNNNKKMFEEHINKTSSVVMCGHEHFSKKSAVTDLDSYEELVYLEGAALQEGNNSQFNLLLLDTDTNKLTNYSYKYNEDIYEEKNYDSINLPQRQVGIGLKPEWIDALNQISIPLKHPKKENLTLQDIFVFPDLEPLNGLEDRLEQYMDSEEITSSNSTDKVIMLEGDNQSGKTSLLKMLYLNYYRRSVYPLMIQGKDIKHTDITSLLKKEYKNQYLYKKYSFDKYFQLDKTKRVLFIDNFDDSELNNLGKSKFLDLALNNFERIIVMNRQQLNIKSLLVHTTVDDEIKRYRIVSLGYKKRNLLIQKWVKLGLDEMTLDQAVVFEQVKQTFNQLNALLGQQLIPSYPVFILSLLQGLNESLTGFDVSKTSYSYCYSSLIIASLLKSGTDKTKINGMIKFMADFAYHIYISTPDVKCFSQKVFDDFWGIYAEDYQPPYSADTLLRKLCEADIIRRYEEDSYSFAYKYIFYFLVAQKISELVNDGKDNGIVKKLCDNLHKEREANILIFLVYHNGIDKQMDELLFASWLPFENYEPITLDKTDPLFTDLNGIVENIKAKVIRNDVDPEEERQKQLEYRDKHSHTGEKALPTEEDFERNKDLRDINNTFKIIRILGQIVKNQKETMKKEDLIRLIDVSYKVCFRSLAFFNKMVDDCKEDIVTYFMEQNKGKNNVDGVVLKNKVWHFMHMMLYRQCLMAFGNLSHSVGTSDMSEIYDGIAKRMGTPAAKIISFTIKTIFNKMRLSDLQDIVNEFKDNPVALEIIKSRVISYVYNNYVDLGTRQKIGQLCNLRLVDNSGVNKKKLFAKK